MAVDPNNRIKYDAVKGCWKVLHNGVEYAENFKSSGEAFAKLESLLKPPVKMSP